MSNDKTGGPAFPTEYACEHAGMTLRDWFAGQALIGMLSSDVAMGILCEATTAGDPGDTVIKTTYEIADAMITERGK